MIPQGLSLLQAPPFSIIARFFLTAIVFGLAGVFLSAYMILTDRFSLPALVHIYTLGFMAMTMLGALFQMLPVVAGAVIENPLPKATFTHILMSVGIPFLVWGFLSGSSAFMLTGMVLLSIGIYFITFIMLLKLLKLRSYTPTSRGMKYAIALFMMGILFGMVMILSLNGYLQIDYTSVIKMHMSIMLFGWVALLIASVAFQVIEMFFVTPPFPKVYAGRFPLILTILVLIGIVTNEHITIRLLMSALLISLAVLTATRLMNRRRKIPDPLINLWYLGMGLLTAAMLIYPFTELSYKVFLLFLFLFGSFSHSIIMAMMYRIIPFLVWLHLSNKGIPNAPTMHEVIRPKRIWMNYYIHLATIVLFLLSFFSGNTLIWSVCIVTYSISFGLLLYNISSGVLVYVRTANQQGVFPPH